MKLEKVTESGKAKRWYDDACGTALALEIVGERWALLIMRELVYGPRRFGEIRANLPGISANVLTQRLESLGETGVLVRRKLPSPANVQVYELTDWGREAAPLMRQLGAWAARSPRHDPLAFMSPASAVMSLETLAVPARLRGVVLAAAIQFPDDRFVVEVRDGTIHARRGDADKADLTFTGNTLAMRVTVYGKAPLGSDGGLVLVGDPAKAQAFVDLFALPEKIAGVGS